MALTTTTLNGAVSATATSFVVTSATGFASGSYVQLGEEFCQITKEYSSGTTIYVVRGVNGTVPLAHPTGSNATVGTGSDFSSANATVIVPYALSARRRKKLEYSASGAITLPTAGEDMLAVLNGTSVLAMTIAAPGKDNDGDRLTIIGNGAAAHTLTFAGGISGAGSNYDVVTVNATAPIAFEVMACNGLWMSIVNVPLAGTVTNITGTVA